MKHFLAILALILAGNLMSGQDSSFSKPGKNFYRELPNPAVTPTEEWARVSNNVNVSFANDNVRYPKEKVPAINQNTWQINAWKGEKVHTQILVWTKKPIPGLKFSSGDLKNSKGEIISKNNVKLGFVRYVMTDEFGKGCDKRKKSDYDSSLVEDVIDIIGIIPVEGNTVQPIWLSVQVPGNTGEGRYIGAVTIDAGEKIEMKIELNVSSHQLPPPSGWKYDLDLWQSGTAIAKVHDVPMWSKQHFEVMKPYFKMLADAGQKIITANIIEQPWQKGHVFYNDPTYIKWIRKKDGTWKFDYTIFDKYIEMVMSCGIDQRINCYSMVTWDLNFAFHNEALGRLDTIKAKPGSKEYEELWTPMLKDFAAHLRQKGWFEKTCIAMDERPMESMKAVISMLRKLDPGWKIALAGNYHPEIEMEIYDYCLNVGLLFSKESLEKRKAAGMPSTYYTACGTRTPNSFSYSPPAENAWISWYAAKEGFTGYLRWAYNNWAITPLVDTRFRTWPAGDCYQVYPGPRSSIRFEKYIEGIQDFEKIRILREEFTKTGNKQGIKELDGILSEFELVKLKTIPAEDMIVAAKKRLNKL